MSKSKEIVLITGVSGLVGKVIAESLLLGGYKVIGIFKSDSSRKNLKELESQYKDDFINFQCDITSSTEIHNLINKSINDKGLSPDILINNARSIDNLSVDKKGRPIGKNFVNEFKLSIVGHYEIAMALVDSKSSNLKRIINIGSIYGSIVPKSKIYEDFNVDSPIHYGVVKSSMVHLTKELAVRLAKLNILVNCVSYGGIKGRSDHNFVKRYELICPLGKMLDEEDIFPPIEFFLSDNVKNITGQNLIIDGGFSLQ